MKYIDLHCDALTKEGAFLHVTGEKLRASDCLLECFAVFTARGGFGLAERIAAGFPAYCAREGIAPLTEESSASGCRAMLTLENCAALEGSLTRLEDFRRLGVRMATLTWNYPNELGFPSIRDYEGSTLGHGCHGKRETERGLTKFGKEAVEAMADMGIAVDVSHGSDKLLFDVADILKKPFLASHSNADAVFSHPRNLTDEGIRTIADAGGAVGLNFCMDFLSEDRSPEGQRRALLAHTAHILAVGGEDTPALGSDFDGIPTNSYVRTAEDVPRLLADLEEAFGGRIAEKIAFRNAARVLRSCLGRNFPPLS